MLPWKRVEVVESESQAGHIPETMSEGRPQLALAGVRQSMEKLTAPGAALPVPKESRKLGRQ